MKLRAVEERVEFSYYAGNPMEYTVEQKGSTERYVRRIKLISSEVVPN